MCIEDYYKTLFTKIQEGMQTANNSKICYHAPASNPAPQYHGNYQHPPTLNSSATPIPWLLSASTSSQLLSDIQLSHYSDHLLSYTRYEWESMASTIRL